MRPLQVVHVLLLQVQLQQVRLVVEAIGGQRLHRDVRRGWSLGGSGGHRRGASVSSMGLGVFRWGTGDSDSGMEIGLLSRTMGLKTRLFFSRRKQAGAVGTRASCRVRNNVRAGEGAGGVVTAGVGGCGGE